MRNFFGNPNGIGTFKLLEGADAATHRPYLSLPCGVDELSVFPSRAAPTSWSWFRTSIVGVTAVQSRPVQLDSVLSCITFRRFTRRRSQLLWTRVRKFRER